MTFFPEPLRPSEGRKEDHPIVDPIESDKKLKESGVDWELPGGDRVSVCGVFLSFMKEVFSLCARYGEAGSSPVVQEEVLSSLHALKELFHHLQAKDQSKTPKFCQDFSETWNILFRELCIITRSKRGDYIDLERSLQVLITDIEHYPSNEERKLGFYLQKYAGKEWFPIPFREILTRLHLDHCVNQEGSILSKWLELITHILQK